MGTMRGEGQRVRASCMPGIYMCDAGGDASVPQDH